MNKLEFMQYMVEKTNPLNWGVGSLPDDWKWRVSKKGRVVALSVTHGEVSLMDVVESSGSDCQCDSCKEDKGESLTAEQLMKIMGKPTETKKDPMQTVIEMMKGLSATEVTGDIEEVIKNMSQLLGPDFKVSAIDLSPPKKAVPNENETPAPQEPAPKTGVDKDYVSDLLTRCNEVLKARSVDREQENERSMVAIVNIFNQLTGVEITEQQGWLFMTVLKLVRSQLGSKFREDDYLDGINYFALTAEAATK